MLAQSTSRLPSLYSRGPRIVGPFLFHINIYRHGMVPEQSRARGGRRRKETLRI
jgi:hypothetical protein